MSDSIHFVPVLDMMIEYACDRCNYYFRLDEIRYHCTRCRDYDLCKKCYLMNQSIDQSINQSATQSTVTHKHDDDEITPRWIEASVPPRPSSHSLPPDLSFAATIQNSFERFASRVCVGQRIKLDDPTSIKWITHAEMRDRVNACRSSVWPLISSLVIPTDRKSYCNCTISRPHVAIWASNSVNWLSVNLACHMQHCLVVPVDPNLDSTSAKAIMKQMEISVLFVDCAMFERAEDLSSVRLVVLLDEPSDNARVNHQLDQSINHQLDQSIPRIVSLDRLLHEAPEYQTIPLIEASPDCVVSVTYTSGSTQALAKGVLMSDRCHAYRQGQESVSQDLRIAIVLPLSNGTGNTQAIRCLNVGGTIGLIRRPSDFMEDLVWIQPTMLSGPPKMWNTLYAGYRDDLRRIKSRVDAPLDPDACELIALGGFRARLGGRVQSTAVGGAASEPDLMHFLEKCFGYSQAHESYGATECGSIARDGLVMHGVDVKLLPVPELGLFPSDQPWPRGELCVHTQNMAHSIVAGSELAFIRLEGQVYYRTGDAAELRPPRKSGGRSSIQLLGRVSDIVKFSNGLYVALEVVEQIIETKCHHVEHVFMHVAQGRDELVAVLVPQLSAPRDWTELEWTEEIRGLVRSRDLASHCVPVRMFVDRRDMSWENLGLLATQSKKRRPLILKHYKDVIDRMLHDAVVTDASLDQNSSVTSLKGLQALILSQLKIANTSFDQVQDHSWTQVGGDSMSAIALAYSLNRLHPSRSITATDILAATSLQQLVVGMPSSSRASKLPTNIDWQTECALPANICRCQPPHSSLTPVTLLTGAAGFLGTFLLAELLHRGTDKVVCIVRAASDQEAKSRVMNSLDVYNLASLSSKMSNVSVYAGDISVSNFGLSYECYQQLVATVTLVVHNASHVNFVLPYAALRNDNVQSTINIIRFCSESHLKRLCYVSTASIEHLNTANIDQSASRYTGYALSKFVSEQLVQCAATEFDIPALIVRPTSIIGDSKYGFGPVRPSTDMISALWLGLAETNRIHVKGNSNALLATDLEQLISLSVPSPPFQILGAPGRLRLVPVDYVARATISHLFSNGASNGTTLTLTSAHDVSVLSLLVAAHMPSITPVLCGHEAEQVWRSLVISDELPIILRPFRIGLLASYPLDTVSVGPSAASSSQPQDEFAPPVIDLATLRRCYIRLRARQVDSSNEGES